MSAPGAGPSRAVPAAAVAAALALALGACPSPQWNLVSEEDLEEGEGIFHTVAKGETLYRICKTYGVDLQTVAEENDIEDPSKIAVGDRIFLPGAREITAAPDAGTAAVVAAAHPREPAGVKEEDEPRPAVFRGKFVWPTKGVVTSRFGVRGGNKHQGIDIAAPKGTPVLAAAAGKVIYSDNKLRGYGNLIIIRHDGGFITVYAHNSENLVREGDAVTQAKRIASVGATGNAEAPHLHFEIRENARPRNPLFFLP